MLDSSLTGDAVGAFAGFRGSSSEMGGAAFETVGGPSGVQVKAPRLRTRNCAAVCLLAVVSAAGCFGLLHWAFGSSSVVDNKAAAAAPSGPQVFGSCKDEAHSFMDCHGAASCAVLVLETGNGTGYYAHESPSVHGLWPQSGRYGSSACVSPRNATAVAGFLPPCYDNAEAHEHNNTNLAHQLDFVQHEWTKHGSCSGALDEAGYFDTICGLARQGTHLMDNSRPLQSIANTLYDAGLPVYCVDTGSSQVYLSTCASRNAAGILAWGFARQENFATQCDLAPPPEPEPAPEPEPPIDHCIQGQHGPPCADNSDCLHVQNCLRCAHSGFCTMEP